LSATAPVSDSRSESAGYKRILLASEGRPFPDAALARTIELARRSGASVHVFTIARVHGTAFGMPAPGLLPSKQEWAQQRAIVSTAIKRLKRKGIEADGHVLGTRNATKKILDEAALAGCDAIVMAADPDRSRFTATMMWSQEPQRVRRKAQLPVILVPDPNGEDS
jgi:nucleotide-binding universal stress UspA family protein